MIDYFFLSVRQIGVKAFNIQVNPGDIIRGRKMGTFMLYILIPKSGPFKNRIYQFTEALDFSRINMCYHLKELEKGIWKYLEPKRPKYYGGSNS